MFGTPERKADSIRINGAVNAANITINSTEVLLENSNSKLNADGVSTSGTLKHYNIVDISNLFKFLRPWSWITCKTKQSILLQRRRTRRIWWRN